MTGAVPTVRPGAPRPQVAIVWLLALPVLVFAGLGIGLANGVHGSELGMLGLALVTAAVGFVPIILDLGRSLDRRHLLLSILAIAYVVYFSVPVFTTYFFFDVLVDTEYLDKLDLLAIRPHDTVNGQIAALVGLVVLLIGYAIPIGRLVPGGIPTPRRDWPYRATLVVAGIMIPLGWGIYLASQFRILPSRAGSGFLGMISNSTYFGIALLTLTYMRHRAQGALVMMALLIPPTMAFNFFTGSKTLLLTPAAIVVAVYFVMKRRIAVRWILAGFAAVILVYPVAEFHRRVILRGNTRGAADVITRPAEVVSRISRFMGSWEFGDYMLQGVAATSRRFDGLGVVATIVRDCPSRVPFQGGWTLSYIVLSYVPRIVWADKPDMTIGQWVTTHFGSGPGIASNTAPTWVGELYFNFGWPGIVIGMTFMGVFLRILHEVLFPPNPVMPTLVMSVVAMFTIPQTLQAGLIGPINGVIFAAMPVVMTHWMVRLVAGSPRAPAPRSDEPAEPALDASSSA